MDVDNFKLIRGDRTSDSVKKECSRPKCQFPTRCFWTKLREQEATESLYIANECLTIQETPLRIARQQEKGISQDNIPLKDPSLPATGLKMTDLDNQVKTATPTAPIVKSEQLQNQLLSSDDTGTVGFKENLNESVSNDSVIISKNGPYSRNLLRFKNGELRVIKKTLITPGIRYFKDTPPTEQTSEDMEPASNFPSTSSSGTQQDISQVTSVSVCAITASDQSGKPNSSVGSNKEIQPEGMKMIKPMDSKVMATMLEEFMEQQEEIEARKMRNGDDKAYGEKTDNTNSEEIVEWKFSTFVNKAKGSK